MGDYVTVSLETKSMGHAYLAFECAIESVLFVMLSCAIDSVFYLGMVKGQKIANTKCKNVCLPFVVYSKMELLTLPALNRMAICGGTHGNEMTGVYLVQEMARRQKEEGEKAWPLPLILVLSNPLAIQQCRRYTDTDLNRCFTSAILR